MKKYLIIIAVLVLSCKNDQTEEKKETHITSVKFEEILKDSLSIRALEIMGNNVAIGANKGIFGLYHSDTGNWKLNVQKNDSVAPEFRAIASTSNDFFMISVGNPGLLYKTGDNGAMELVYKEENENVFYDAIAFWNNDEGIAMGDPTDGCISIIITRDGGKSWNKINCSNLPEAAEGEAAFAASNGNISIQGDKTWILTGGMKSRVLYSGDKGNSWQVFDTPLIQGTATTGGYAMDFYDAENGIIVGGDYTQPDENVANKAVTKDGGKTWKLVADGKDPGYKSSVRYVPGSDGKEIVAVGFSGISYSDDSGENWKNLSEEGFYTIRFLNDSVAYAAGNMKVAKLNFKRKEVETISKK